VSLVLINYYFAKKQKIYGIVSVNIIFTTTVMAVGIRHYFIIRLNEIYHQSKFVLEKRF